MAVKMRANDHDDHANNGHPASSPPVLPRRQPIQLPPTLPAGVPRPLLHPLLQNGASPLTMTWNVRTLPLSAGSPSWMSQPATYPALDSMAIRVTSGRPWGRRESDTPIVVFPNDDEDGGGVTVRDVLGRVHGAFAFQHLPPAGEPRTRPVMWVGIMPSDTEREVWILQVYVA